MKIIESRLIVVATALALLLSGCADEQSVVPESIVRQNTLGTAYLGQQEWGNAADAFRGALAERGDDPLLLTNLAVALMQDGEVEDAERHLLAALERDDVYPYARYNLGLIEINRGEYEAAVSHFEVVASDDPEDVMTLYNLGTAYASLGRTEDATSALRRAIELNPEHVSSLYALGRELVKQGETEEGRELVSRSQAIRTRSGLDAAVGSQYGEQGPYALGVDYPADSLSAPSSIQVSFAALDERAPSASSTTLARVSPNAEPALIVSNGTSLGRLSVGAGYATLLPDHPTGGTIMSLAAGDGDNDSVVELYALVSHADAATELALIEQSASGELKWEEPTWVSGIEVLPDDVSVADLLLVDREHDGDLDLVLCWAPSDDSSCAIATNDGSGRMAVSPSAEHGFELRLGDAETIALALTDHDNDRDVDFIVSEPGGIHVLSNLRDGTFTSIGDDIGLGARAAGMADAVVADVNKDSWMDIVAGGPTGLWLYESARGKFGDAERIAEHTAPVTTVAVVDADNDGFLDLVASNEGEPATVYRNGGRGEWNHVTRWLEGVGNVVVTDAFDADGDGDLDLVGELAGDVALVRNDGGNANSWIAVESRGVGDNRYGVGAKVEVLAGALRQKYEVSGPLPVHAGLGARDSVDSVRHLWPSGVLQDEVQQRASASIDIEQLDRKGTSCPILYVWRDGRWEFETDFMGGSAVGYQLSPGVFNMPDTDEYVKLEPGPTIDADGTIRIRVNNQLQEILWFDKLELVAIDHPAGTELFPNERLMPRAPWPEYDVFISSHVAPIASATGIEDGRNWSSALASVDGEFIENFSLARFKGYADMHTLELDLGTFDETDRVVMLLDGWIDYADSTANVAASQAGLALSPPTLMVADGKGGWRDTGHLMGFPAGLPKTMAVELTGLFRSDDHRVRIATNMRIYWDRARVLTGGTELSYTSHRLSPIVAELDYGGFPLERGRGSRTPKRYDPSIVSMVSPWTAHVGRYTGFGDVKDLVSYIDDRMVTTRAGDQIELRFKDPAPPPDGYTRTYMFFADGFGKDMDTNSAANATVGPVPFHGMPSYPYPGTITPPQDISDTLTRLVLGSERGWPGALPLALAPAVKPASETERVADDGS